MLLHKSEDIAFQYSLPNATSGKHWLHVARESSFSFTFKNFIALPRRKPAYSVRKIDSGIGHQTHYEVTCGLFDVSRMADG
jgi:hypothetical protein